MAFTAEFVPVTAKRELKLGWTLRETFWPALRVGMGLLATSTFLCNRCSWGEGRSGGVLTHLSRL